MNIAPVVQLVWCRCANSEGDHRVTRQAIANHAVVVQLRGRAAHGGGSDDKRVERRHVLQCKRVSDAADKDKCACLHIAARHRNVGRIEHGDRVTLNPIAVGGSFAVVRVGRGLCRSLDVID